MNTGKQIINRVENKEIVSHLDGVRERQGDCQWKTLGDSNNQHSHTGDDEINVAIELVPLKLLFFKDVCVDGELY